MRAEKLEPHFLIRQFQNGTHHSTEESIQFVCIFLLAVLLTIVIGRRYYSSLSKYPGPFLGSFSTLWQMRHAMRGNFSKDLHQLHLDHGDFVRISHREISVTHPDAVRDVLQAPLRSPKEASRRQKNIGNAYTVSSILPMEPQMDDVLRHMRECFFALADAGKAVEVGDFWTWAAFDIVGEVTFSRRFGFLNELRDIGGAIASTGVLMRYATVMGYAIPLHTLLLDNPFMRALNRVFRFSGNVHAFKVATDALDGREKSSDGKQDMVARWFENLNKSRGSMDLVEIHAAATSNISAGSDTVSAALQSLYYHALQAPDALRLLEEEVLAADAAGALSDIPQHKEVSQLPYLQACVKEALRMHPAGPWSLPRKAPAQGLKLGDEHFPAGTLLSVNPWVIHYHPKLFERPKSFEPERWLDPERKAKEGQFWIPFGAGYNRCPGRQLAMMEVAKMAALMIRDFEIERADPNQEWKWHNNFSAVPYGWDCYVRRRGGEKAN
ncbi:Cytochrome P450 monooxygenase gsfF-like protein [Cladobotryum mycophilum]|uniref:Cytochrome P450 monooxygenase gsfF-like protein n=1 Tax=Cladobotryum mycophilum TaxID=491253 RepID=A0ABR0SZ76_9HYPO